MLASENKTVLKAAEVINKRIEALDSKLPTLKEKIEQKYPYEVYGIKAEGMYDEQSAKIKDEIKLLEKYNAGMHELFEMIEGGRICPENILWKSQMVKETETKSLLE